MKVGLGSNLNWHIKNMAKPNTINTSLLITNTANQAGMNFMIARVMNAVERSSLSAMGSKCAPKVDFLW